MAAGAGAPLVSLHCAHLPKELNLTCQQEEAAKDKEVGRVAGAEIRARAVDWRDQESGKLQ